MYLATISTIKVQSLPIQPEVVVGTKPNNHNSQGRV